MSENKLKWSTGIDTAIKSGDPLKAGVTALTNYFPATFEMMGNGSFKAGLGLLLLSFIGLPTATITATVLAALQRKN